MRRFFQYLMLFILIIFILPSLLTVQRKKIQAVAQEVIEQQDISTIDLRRISNN